MSMIAVPPAGGGSTLTPLGLLYQNITNPFFAEVIVAIDDRLATSGFVTLFGNTSEDAGVSGRWHFDLSDAPWDTFEGLC